MAERPFNSISDDISESSLGRPPGPAVRRAAEQWLARQDRGLTEGEARELAAWRAAAPENARELDRLAAAWNAADLIKADADLVELTQQVDLTTRREQRLRRERRTRIGWMGGLAAAAAVALLVSVQNRTPVEEGAARISVNLPATAAIEVVPRTAKRVNLPDGSAVDVRGDSELQTLFTETERRIRLVRGEAHFQVKKDQGRPFVVEAGGLAVRAVGTAFNVRLHTAAVDVLVTEGKVSLHEREDASAVSPAASADPASPRISAGQRTHVVPASAGVKLAPLMVESLSPAEIEQELSWQRTRLVLQRAPLAEAIAAFNLHGGTRLVLGDEALRTRRLSGTFRADNSEAFVRLLEQAAEVRVERQADGVVVLYAAP